MQYKLRCFINNLLLCAGVTVYTVSIVILYLLENKTMFSWVGMLFSGIVSLASGYILEKRGELILYDTKEKALPTMIFGISCILVPVMILIFN